MAEWKKVIVSGSNAELNNIFASGAITGSHISSSGDLFASLVTASTTNVVTYNTTTGKFHYTASSNVGSNTIGTPTDGTYTDGLFPFESTTTVANAVDDINEVLAGLAPPAAPALDYIDATSWTTADWESGNYYLAFGNSLSTSSYSNLNLSSTTGFSNVDFGNIYTGSAGATGTTVSSRIRLGVLASNATPITITLNNDVAANSGTYVNYPADAFKANSTPTAGETYTIDINGTTYTYTATTSASVTNEATTPSGPTITLTTAQTGSFIGTGQSFSLFRHRTGTVSIPASTWRTGSNYARVSSSIAGGPTTYIDWVFDPAAASGNFPYTFSTPTSTSFSATGEKALSGVKYYTNISYNFSCSLSNYYKNSYRSGTLAASDSSQGFGSFSSPAPTATAVNISTPTTADSIFQINSAHSFSSNSSRLLGTSLASRVNVSNGLGKTGNSSTLTTPTILYDNLSTANTVLIENFCLENYRVPSASYNTQAAASTAINTFPSTSALTTSDLAVYNGAARYPTQLFNGGNINGSSIVYKIAGQPDYSSATGNRSFYRVFQNGASQVAGWTIRLDGSDATFVTSGSSLTGNNMTLEIKVPDETGWRDVIAAAPSAGTYNALDDGVGCRSGATIALGGTGGLISLVSERLGPNEYFVLRFTVGSSWTGNINKITITGL
jgi:hypothetical protein